MSQILIGSPTIGTLWADKLLSYNNQIAERPGEKNRSVTGATVHQVGTADDSDRVITGAIRVSEITKNTLFSMLTTTSSFLLTLQDGEDAYKGYMKSISQQAQAAKGRHRYDFTFFVTEKLTA